MINKLYISTVDNQWDLNLLLLDQHNVNKILNNAEPIDVRTSIEDLHCENITKVCNAAKEIILISLTPVITNNNFFAYGRLFNQLTRLQNKVIGMDQLKFDIFDVNTLYKTSDNTGATIWAAGCSITNGYGVQSNQRWSTLLAKKLNCNEISLARNGSSINWAADQILRSDLQEGDIVVWRLTNVPRIDIAKDWEFKSVTIATYHKQSKNHQYWNLDFFESQTQVLGAMRNILQVINFCKKIKVELYIVNLLDIAWVSTSLRSYDYYIDLTTDLQIVGNNVTFIDVGSDNYHPGPAQHEQYATKIFNFIKENNHGQTI